MKVKAVRGILCPGCGEFVEAEDIPPIETLYQCGECEEVFEDRDEAKECCRD